ncbi:MAG: hypothetical protein ACYTXY_37790 [Nostoc sp.]
MLIRTNKRSLSPTTFDYTPQAVKHLNGKTKHSIQSGQKTRLYFLANHHTRR